MTEKTKAIWEKASEEGSYELGRTSPCDLEAFNILIKYRKPRTGDLVSCASHDQIWLDISEEEIESIPEEVVFRLSTLGVWYDTETDGLSMFV